MNLPERFPNWLKAAMWTSWFTFVGTTLAAILPLLAAVEGWVNGSNEVLIDDLSIFAKVVFSAFIAAVSGIVNAAVRYGQSRNVLPGTEPRYIPTKK